jgi:hypothetical protein
MNPKLKGQCLCGDVKFELLDDFKAFFQCHCSQCQRLTGSAFASNLFTQPDNIEWTSGEDAISCYEHPTREFSKSFCKTCGSAVPFINKRNTSLVVPAGSLLDKPSLPPQANIFTAEEAHWLAEGLQARKFEGFPE